MKRVLVILFCALSLSLFVSCATQSVYRASLPLSESTEIQSTMDAISYVLYENGFEIKQINPAFGIIETEYKDMGLTDIGMTFAVAALTGNAANYQNMIRLSFKVSADSYSVTPRYVKRSVVSSWTTAKTTDTEQELKFDSEIGKKVVSIVEEINALIGITGEIQWEPVETIK